MLLVSTNAVTAADSRRLTNGPTNFNCARTLQVRPREKFAEELKTVLRGWPCKQQLTVARIYCCNLGELYRRVFRVRIAG